MSTLDDLKAERFALLKRIAGQKTMVTAPGRMVQFDQSAPDKKLAILDQEIARLERAEQGSAGPSRVVRFTTRSGY